MNIYIYMEYGKFKIKNNSELIINYFRFFVLILVYFSSPHQEILEN